MIRKSLGFQLEEKFGNIYYCRPVGKKYFISSKVSDISGYRKVAEYSLLDKDVENFKTSDVVLAEFIDNLGITCVLCNKSEIGI